MLLLLSIFLFCSKILPDQESCVNESLAIAKIIASKSPIAVQGSKINLIYSRDHGVPTSLKYMVNKKN